jgi:hypothetical protein
MTIAGRTFNQAAVARLLTRLSTVPTLTGVQLTRSAFTVVGTRRVVEFEIVANLRGAGDAS